MLNTNIKNEPMPLRANTPPPTAEELERLKEGGCFALFLILKWPQLGEQNIIRILNESDGTVVSMLERELRIRALKNTKMKLKNAIYALLAMEEQE